MSSDAERPPSLPDSPLTAEFRGALQGLQSQSNAAVDASKEVIKRHLEFCHLVSDNLHSASQAGWVQYDQRIIGASNGINFASSDLCWKVKILQEGIDYFLRIVESVNTGAAAHKASWWSWGRIKEAVPAVLRTTGYIMAGAGTVLRIIHPAGALVENMMQAVQNLLSASANRMERSLEGNAQTRFVRQYFADERHVSSITEKTAGYQHHRPAHEHAGGADTISAGGAGERQHGPGGGTVAQPSPGDANAD